MFGVERRSETIGTLAALASDGGGLGATVSDRGGYEFGASDRARVARWSRGAIIDTWSWGPRLGRMRMNRSSRRCSSGWVLVEPERRINARARVRTFPAMSSARVALVAVGRLREVACAYLSVLSVLADQVGALFGLSMFASDSGSDPETAECVPANLVERRPEDPLYALLLADIRRRSGQMERACAVVQETLDRLQEPPGERSGRWTTLGRCSIVGFGH